MMTLSQMGLNLVTGLSQFREVWSSIQVDQSSVKFSSLTKSAIVRKGNE